MSPDAQIYDIETYQPANCVGQLMYRVRSAQMSALDEALGQDPDLAPLEISAAQYIIISVLAKRGVDSPVRRGCDDADARPARSQRPDHPAPLSG